MAATTVDGVTTVDELVVTAKPSAVASSLHQASFRGRPFAVLHEESQFGRRVSLHEYVYRDTPWPEDLGRKARAFNLTGFLVTDSLIYGGGDVLAQRDAFIVALETKGPGTLVHPTLGELYCTVMGAGISAGWDEGRYYELQLSFVEAGNRVFPGSSASTGDATASAASGLDSAASGDFASGVMPLLAAGGVGSLQNLVAETGRWASRATALGADASSLLNLASRLTGPYGRYFNGANQGFGAAIPTVFQAGTTIDDLVAIGAARRASLATAAAGETAVAAAIGLPGALATDLAAATQAMAASLLATTANPADALRIMGALASYSTDGAAPVAGAVGDLHRRAAVAALARASAIYQPTSAEDASAVRALVTGALEAEITLAGDQGDDASYGSLRALRTAVVQDLAARGAGLASMITLNFPAALPSLVLANQLYRDAGRADDLVVLADPIHPLFMPLEFQALAA